MQCIDRWLGQSWGPCILTRSSNSCIHCISQSLSTITSLILLRSNLSNMQTYDHLRGPFNAGKIFDCALILCRYLILFISKLIFIEITLKYQEN